MSGEDMEDVGGDNKVIPIGRGKEIRDKKKRDEEIERFTEVLENAKEDVANYFQELERKNAEKKEREAKERAKKNKSLVKSLSKKPKGDKP